MVSNNNLSKAFQQLAIMYIISKANTKNRKMICFDFLAFILLRSSRVYLKQVNLVAKISFFFHTLNRLKTLS